MGVSTYRCPKQIAWRDAKVLVTKRVFHPPSPPFWFSAGIGQVLS